MRVKDLLQVVYYNILMHLQETGICKDIHVVLKFKRVKVILTDIE